VVTHTACSEKFFLFHRTGEKSGRRRKAIGKNPSKKKEKSITEIRALAAPERKH